MLLSGLNEGVSPVSELGARLKDGEVGATGPGTSLSVAAALTDVLRVVRRHIRIVMVWLDREYFDE